MATKTRTRTTSDELMLEAGDMAADFGDRRKKHRRRHKKSHKRRGLYGLFGDVRKRLRRPYLRRVVRSGRKLAGKHKIGHVGRGGRGQFRWVTRGGSVWSAHVTKKKGGGRKSSRRHRKHTKRGRKK